MKTIYSDDITQRVASLCLQCNYELPEDILSSLIRAEKKETHPRAKKILQCLIENADIAKKEQLAICQDCGIGIFFVELGQEVFIQGNLYEAIQKGMALAYQKGYLRKSVVNHPLLRVNSGNNLPAIIHTELKMNDQLILYFSPKGAGSENCSKTCFFNPTAQLDEIEAWIYTQTLAAAKKACGPLILGIGIGGSSEYAPYLAKKALLRNIGERNRDEILQGLELKLLSSINTSGIGPQGLGGDTAVFDVFIESYATHIAMLPVSINFQCHAARHGKVIW